MFQHIYIPFRYTKCEYIILYINVYLRYVCVHSCGMLLIAPQACWVSILWSNIRLHENPHCNYTIHIEMRNFPTTTINHPAFYCLCTYRACVNCVYVNIVNWKCLARGTYIFMHIIYRTHVHRQWHICLYDILYLFNKTYIVAFVTEHADKFYTRIICWFRVCFARLTQQPSPRPCRA